MSYLFVFRTYPDVDHMVPLAWRLLSDGEEVHAVVSPGYDVANDHRLRFLQSFERFQLHVASTWWRRLPTWAFAIMLRHRPRVVCVEWGYGFHDGYDNLRSLAGVRDLLRSLVGSVRRVGDPKQTRMNFMIAARLLGSAVACFPHGLSVKLGKVLNDQMARDFAQGNYDWRDRNRFSAYFVNTEHHLQWHLDHANGDPQVMQNLGSLRWAPDWFELNRQLVHPHRWHEDTQGKVKVVYMTPKGENRLNADASIELLRRLSAADHVSLAVKAHPRHAENSQDPLRT